MANHRRCVILNLAPGNRQAGQKLENAGLLIGKRTLEQFVPREI